MCKPQWDAARWRRWTNTEITKLIALHSGGGTAGEISVALCRPRGSVATKITELQKAGVLVYRTSQKRGIFHLPTQVTAVPALCSSGPIKLPRSQFPIFKLVLDDLLRFQEMVVRSRCLDTSLIEDSRAALNESYALLRARNDFNRLQIGTVGKARTPPSFACVYKHICATYPGAKWNKSPFEPAMQDKHGSSVYWMQRAKSAREEAATMHNPLARRCMEGIAATYEMFAKRSAVAAALRGKPGDARLMISTPNTRTEPHSLGRQYRHELVE